MMNSSWGFSQGMMSSWGGFFPGFFVPLAVWSAIWTGFALWHAARRGEKWWFILFLLVHTAGILEIIYLLFVVHAFTGVEKKTHAKTRRGRK